MVPSSYAVIKFQGCALDIYQSLWAPCPAFSASREHSDDVTKDDQLSVGWRSEATATAPTWDAAVGGGPRAAPSFSVTAMDLMDVDALP